jgi:glutamate/tyrosine decarboxylase-like PLP-dependent enzyme
MVGVRYGCRTGGYKTAYHFSGPTIVCTQAGNVNTGAFDPIQEVCRKAHAAGAWVHVDGAFGLWAAAAPGRAHLAAGMAEADSWATDAHKWLNVPYDCGLAFVQNPEALRAAMAITADYLPPAGTQRNPSDYTPELSRRARGVEVWAALKLLGKAGVADLVERTCRYAARFAEGLGTAGFEVLNDVSSTRFSSHSGARREPARSFPTFRQRARAGAGVLSGRGKPR